MSKLKITLSKSLISRKKEHIAIVNALGLKKIGDTVECEDTSQVRGAIRKVGYLLSVKE